MPDVNVVSSDQQNTPNLKPDGKKSNVKILVLIIVLLSLVCFLLLLFLILPFVLANFSSQTKSTVSLSSSVTSTLSSETSSEDSLDTTTTSSTVNSSRATTATSTSKKAGINTSTTTTATTTASTTTTTPTTTTTTSSVPFAVSNITINVDNADSPVKTCGQVHTFKFTGTITANGAGTVNYYWFRDDIGKYTNESVVFTGAGTKAISKDVDVISTGQYDPFTIQVQVFLTPDETKYSNVKVIRFHNICI